MKVIVINEENHGFIRIAKDYHSAIDFLIARGWINEYTKFYDVVERWQLLSWFVAASPYTNVVDFLYDKIDNDRDFFDGSFYFDEEEVYE